MATGCSVAVISAPCNSDAISAEPTPFPATSASTAGGMGSPLKSQITADVAQARRLLGR